MCPEMRENEYQSIFRIFKQVTEIVFYDLALTTLKYMLQILIQIKQPQVGGVLLGGS